MDRGGSDAGRGGLTRREVLAAAAAAGAAAALPEALAGAAAPAHRIDFGALGDGEGWGAGWACHGVANLRREGGEGLLEAGSDVFPNDPRPLAFRVDERVRDARISALMSRAGAAAGVVLRRTRPDTYYAAVYDSEAAALLLLRREAAELVELARAPLPLAAPPFTITLSASGAAPTALAATLTDGLGRAAQVEAADSSPLLQRAGDPGVLATAKTYLTGEEAFPPLGNIRLGFFATQEGLTVYQGPAGEAYRERVIERSTAAFREITVESVEPTRRTPARVLAATTSAPAGQGALLNVATDLPARVTVEVSRSPRFRRVLRLEPQRTGEFEAAIVRLRRQARVRRVYWRARVRRRGRETVGPVRSFRVLPAPGDTRPVRLAIGACASQFGPSFNEIAARRPDVLVWQGDLNYPDVQGPLAQSVSGYAGIWRDFLRNPRMEPILARASFAMQRDDHDYGVQDAIAGNIPPWGRAPWEALMERRPYYRFAAGLLEVWVLDQRQFKHDPKTPDTPEKSLLGAEQRAWLLRTLAASRAPFKLICSPCTLHYGGNARDGNWDAGFTAERDLILEHVRSRVRGQTVFATGDAHDTMVYERDGVFEARACPLSIPDPRDHPGVSAGMFGGEGVAYADTASHFTLVEARGSGRRGTLDVTLVKEDGTEPYTRRFEARVPARR